MPIFDCYIGIDYSGAKTPTSSLKGLRVYKGDRGSQPHEVHPPPSPRRYWTRRGVAEWLVDQFTRDQLKIVGIDHAFSFPQEYFVKYDLPKSWPIFLDDFQQHWPTNDDHTYVDFIRDGVTGNGGSRCGSSRWRRLTEVRAGAAKSVFHFDVQGSVAKSTHSGLPWLRYIRHHMGNRVHFWPYDGWNIPGGKSVVLEVYPSLWSGHFKREDRTGDQHDAYSAAAWMRNADLGGTIAEYLNPNLASDVGKRAMFEGWILGVQ